MPKKKRDLPTPPGGTPFGAKKRFGPSMDTPEMADRLTMAAAQGKLDEVLAEEFGDNPGMRDLAMIMLGGSGMAPAASMGEKNPPDEKGPKAKGPKSPADSKTKGAKKDVPPGLLKAIQSGNTGEVSALLSSEMKKRTGTSSGGKKTTAPKAGAEKEETPYIEKSTLDALMKIAAENDVTIDWVMARAIKLYVRDYLATGRI